MAYITQTQLENRFASLKWWTDDAAAGSINATKVAECISAATGQINGAAGSHFALPLTLSDANTAEILRLHAGNIAGYLLAGRRAAADENLRLMYEDSKEWLKELAAGRVALAGEAAATAVVPSGGMIVAGETAIVTRTEMDGL